MRTRTVHAAAAALGLILAPAAVRADDGADARNKPDEIAWARSFAAARDEAKKAGKLIMVDFYTDWCGWCKKLDKDTYTDKDVIKLSREIVSVKLDAQDKSEGQEAAGKYNVHGYPTILFLDPAEVDSKAGGVVGKIGGYMPPGPFAAEVAKFRRGFEEFPKLKRRLEDSPDDPEALARLSALYHFRGDDKTAEDLLARAEKNGPVADKAALAAAYNAVGDAHQDRRELDEAIALFRKAADLNKDAHEAAYARASIGYCLLMQGKPAEAVAELEAVADIPGVSPGDKDQAETILKLARDAQDRAKAAEKAGVKDDGK